MATLPKIKLQLPGRAIVPSPALPSAPPDQAFRLLIQAGRGTMPAAAPSPLEKRDGAPMTSSPAQMVKAEAPSLLGVVRSRMSGPALAIVSGRAPLPTRATEIKRQLEELKSSEKPQHAWIAKEKKFARSSEDVLRNQKAKRLESLRRAQPDKRPRLSGGLSPIDVANGAGSPRRGLFRMPGQKLPRGTPAAVLEAPTETILTATTPATPDPIRPEPSANSRADRADEATLAIARGPESPVPVKRDGPANLERFALLAGVAFAAWLMLGKGAR